MWTYVGKLQLLSIRSSTATARSGDATSCPCLLQLLSIRSSTATQQLLVRPGVVSGLQLLSIRSSTATARSGDA